MDPERLKEIIRDLYIKLHSALFVMEQQKQY